jgi:hypothetical protein
MSQENVEIVQALVAASQRGDWEAALDNYDPAVELDESRMLDGGLTEAYPSREMALAE